MNDAFATWMKSVQTITEETLSDWLPAENHFPETLHEAMRYAVLGGGKRIRPLLVFATGALFDAPVSVVARGACAVEMIHAYSLIHDDMPCMDNDVLRRGKPTVHVRFGEATALLAGDALQAQAFIVLCDGEDDPELRIRRLRILSEAAGSRGMCGGQAIDLASVGKNLSLGQLEQMHRLKTGALLKASVMLGAWSAKRLAPNETRALENYADAIGLAFQVVDDILDATADSAALGKTAGKDASDHKPTYVSLLGLDTSHELAKKLCRKAQAAVVPFGKKAERLRDLADLVVYRKK